MKTGHFAFPLILAVAQIGNAPLFNLLPTAAKPLASSALGIGIFAAVLVNGFFRFGQIRKTEFELNPLTTPTEHLVLVQNALSAWNVEHNVKVRAMLALRELIDEQCSKLKLHFDGCTLRVDLTRLGHWSEHISAQNYASFFSHHVSDRLILRNSSREQQVLST